MHKIAQWRLCRLHALCTGPGPPARGGQPAGSPTGLLGAACMSTEAFLGLSVQAQPEKRRPETGRGHLLPGGIAATSLASWKQLRVGTAGIAADRWQRRGVCRGKPEMQWAYYILACMCVHVCVCVHVHVIRDRLRRGLKHNCQQPLLSLHPGKRGTIGRPVSCSTPCLQAKNLHTRTQSSKGEEGRRQGECGGQRARFRLFRVRTLTPKMVVFRGFSEVNGGGCAQLKSGAWGLAGSLKDEGTAARVPGRLWVTDQAM